MNNESPISRHPNLVGLARNSVVLVTYGREVSASHTIKKDEIVLTGPDRSLLFHVSGFGTGFVINSAGQVVTCDHILTEAARQKSKNTRMLMWQVTEGGLFCPYPIAADRIVSDKNHDIAVLTPVGEPLLNPLSGPPARRRSGGQPVYYWGWFYSPERHSLVIVLRSGLLRTDLHPAGEGASARLLFEGVAAAGASGSALVNSQGELVGMVSALRFHPNQPTDVGEAVPVSAIYDILSYSGVKPTWEE